VVTSAIDNPTPSPTLVVIRGNSGSGKSSLAKALRLHYGRGCALVEQDYLRRVVLREHDVPGGLAPRLIAQTVRFALDNGFHTVLEGILAKARHATMITDLLRAHRGNSHVFYLDVTLEETLRRHTMRPQVADFTAEEMTAWYQPHDLLGVEGEHVIPEASTFAQSLAFIATTVGLPSYDSIEAVAR
jgi:predicted kinase